MPECTTAKLLNGKVNMEKKICNRNGKGLIDFVVYKHLNITNK
jgi:hypothetical protein